MAHHEKHLQEWVSQNLISEAQATAIQKYEFQKPSSSLYGFLLLGITVVGIGLISLIAANWERIPGEVKLLVDFLLLFAAGYWAFVNWRDAKATMFEVSLAFLLILTMASIGLVSQVFHTGGKLYQALLLWSFVTSGLMLASEKKFVPGFWAAGFFGGLVLFAVDSHNFQIYFHEDPVYILAALPFLAAIFAVISRMASGDSGQTEAFRGWVVLAGLIGIMAGEIPFRHLRGWTGFIPAYSLALVTLTGVLLISEYRKLQKMVIGAAIFFFLLPFHFPLLEIPDRVVYAGNSIIVLGLLAIFFASIRERNLFQFFLILIGLRFLILYFQALGGLAATGVGLIISGILIIGAAVVWNKHRKAISQWAEDLVG